jgi:hypothetical protein
MGCDIHSHAEQQDSGRWVGLSVEAFKARDYGLFGWLAGVRNYSKMAPIAAGRGFPADASRKAANDYDIWRGDAHSESWVSVAELAALDYEQIVETCGGTYEPCEGKKQTLREFLGPDYFAVLRRLQEACADRVVFWFDN